MQVEDHRGSISILREQGSQEPRMQSIPVKFQLSPSMDILNRIPTIAVCFLFLTCPSFVTAHNFFDIVIFEAAIEVCISYVTPGVLPASPLWFNVSIEIHQVVVGYIHPCGCLKFTDQSHYKVFEVRMSSNFVESCGCQCWLCSSNLGNSQSSYQAKVLEDGIWWDGVGDFVAGAVPWPEEEMALSLACWLWDYTKSINLLKLMCTTFWNIHLWHGWHWAENQVCGGMKAENLALQHIQAQICTFLRTCWLLSCPGCGK